MSGPSKPLLLPRLAPHLFPHTPMSGRKQENSSGSFEIVSLTPPESPTSEITRLRAEIAELKKQNNQIPKMKMKIDELEKDNKNLGDELAKVKADPVGTAWNLPEESQKTDVPQVLLALRTSYCPFQLPKSPALPCLHRALADTLPYGLIWTEGAFGLLDESPRTTCSPVQDLRTVRGRPPQPLRQDHLQARDPRVCHPCLLISENPKRPRACPPHRAGSQDTVGVNVVREALAAIDDEIGTQGQYLPLYTAGQTPAFSLLSWSPSALALDALNPKNSSYKHWTINAALSIPARPCAHPSCQLLPQNAPARTNPRCWDPRQRAVRQPCDQYHVITRDANSDSRFGLPANQATVPQAFRDVHITQSRRRLKLDSWSSRERAYAPDTLVTSFSRGRAQLEFVANILVCPRYHLDTSPNLNFIAGVPYIFPLVVVQELHDLQLNFHKVFNSSSV
ncbi:hypothetical protein DFH07DRAFT_1060538 [Mycena maculata]|uniref:Uncharacterized protein n=1 Tax=Mycena maculata TaxID=230809 RepID=A0AAD7NEN6_9AGAR|nr:hypothetical protein DFH07DRAFT_1060538 [Mycena maculata]